MPDPGCRAGGLIRYKMKKVERQRSGSGVAFQ